MNHRLSLVDRLLDGFALSDFISDELVLLFLVSFDFRLKFVVFLFHEADFFRCVFNSDDVLGLFLFLDILLALEQ